MNNLKFSHAGRFVIAGLALAAVLAGPVASAAAQSATATVASATAGVYATPSTSAPVLAELVHGQTVQLAGWRTSDACWVMVVFSGGTGWMRSIDIYSNYHIINLTVFDESGPEMSVDAVRNSRTAASVGRARTNFREGPGTSHRVLAVLSPGEWLIMEGRTGDGSWTKVRRASGAVGWVATSLIQPEFPTSNLPVMGDAIEAPVTTTTTGTYGIGGPYDGQGGYYGGSAHTVRTGETLYSISVYYGVSMNAIIAANGIVNPNLIYIGQVLIIP